MDRQVEVLGKGFKVSEDRTREPSLFQGSGFLRAWGWLSQYTGPPFIQHVPKCLVRGSSLPGRQPWPSNGSPLLPLPYHLIGEKSHCRVFHRISCNPISIGSHAIPCSVPFCFLFFCLFVGFHAILFPQDHMQSHVLFLSGFFCFFVCLFRWFQIYHQSISSDQRSQLSSTKAKEVNKATESNVDAFKSSGSLSLLSIGTHWMQLQF